jgi:hypothetical protein
MSFSVELIENGRILLITVAQFPTKHEINELLDYTKSYLDDAEVTVHFLADISRLKKAPAGLELRYLHSLNHPRRGDYAIVGASPIIRALVEYTFKFFHYSRYTFFDSLEEGYQHVYKRVEAAEQ